MYVIRHDKGNSKSIRFLVVVYAAVQDDVSSPFGKNAPKSRTESHEVRREVALHVRQIAAIELHSKSVSLTKRDSYRNAVEKLC